MLLQAIQYLERMLREAQQQPQNETEGQDKGINIDPQTYCKLGHFNLLIEDYAKGRMIHSSLIQFIEICFFFTL